MLLNGHRHRVASVASAIMRFKLFIFVAASRGGLDWVADIGTTTRGLGFSPRETRQKGDGGEGERREGGRVERARRRSRVVR
jgi:hypothetical protein